MEKSLVAYPAIIQKNAGQVKISFPDLPAADVVDVDEKRAFLRAKIGLAIVIIDLESHYETVPKPSTVAQVAAKSTGDHVELIETDLSQY